MLGEVKIIPLVGVEGVGNNSTIFEFQNQQFLIDVGLGFPYEDLYGVDYVIPNVSYLKKSKNLKGIIITHGHLDHIGGLPYVLPQLNYPPIYCSQFAAELIKNQCERNGADLSKIKFIIYHKDSILRFGNVSFTFFGVNHSIPESMGIIFRTPAGNIVHTGDFKFDNSPQFGQVAEYEKIALAGKEGVLALLSDSTNAFKPGHSLSERAIYENLFDLVKDVKGRVIVSTFSSLVSRIFQLITIATITNRKILVLGRSMQNIIEISKRLEYLKIDAKFFVTPAQARNVAPRSLMVIATGAQGETMAALSRIVRGEHPDFTIKKGDTVILSASIIPGNDMMVQNMIDDLSEQGANVYHAIDEMDLHTSGHGYQEDQKLMINLVKPKFFIPIHGFQSFLYKHAQIAESVGIAKRNILVPKCGEIITVNKANARIIRSVPTNPIFVSGNAVGDVGTTIIAERQQLADSGTVVITTLIKKDTKKILDKSKVVIKGLVYAKDNIALINSIAEIADKTVIDLLAKNKDDEIREGIRRNIDKFVFLQTKKSPLVIVINNFI